MSAEQVEVINSASLQVHRIEVPGGWLYITETHNHNGNALSSTFVPGRTGISRVERQSGHLVQRALDKLFHAALDIDQAKAVSGDAFWRTFRAAVESVRPFTSL